VFHNHAFLPLRIANDYRDPAAGPRPTKCDFFGGQNSPAPRQLSLVFQLAEVAVPRKLFAAILTHIGRLRMACDSGVRSDAFAKSIRPSSSAIVVVLPPLCAC
jgi:hypothetical protein